MLRRIAVVCNPNSCNSSSRSEYHNIRFGGATPEGGAAGMLANFAHGLHSAGAELYLYRIAVPNCSFGPTAWLRVFSEAKNSAIVLW